ncbi:MAG TPA: hypothetical protein VN694_11070 [Caulobacteraceae bacterium]|nr:hypothetical protein [Caulobacteraceae bacterium]
MISGIVVFATVNDVRRVASIHMAIRAHVATYLGLEPHKFAHQVVGESRSKVGDARSMEPDVSAQRRIGHEHAADG